MGDKKSYHIRVSDDVEALLAQAAYRLRLPPTTIATRLLEAAVREHADAEDLRLPEPLSDAELRRTVLELRAATQFQEAALLLLNPAHKPQLKRLRQVVYEQRAASLSKTEVGS